MHVHVKFPTPNAAVQEERQRNREREGELEFSVGVNEEMPVEKILEAETAVEQKTELHDGSGSAGSSVSSPAFRSDIQTSSQSDCRSFHWILGLVFIFAVAWLECLICCLPTAP